jgi:hypothetical protein
MQDYGSIGSWIFLYLFLNDGTDFGTIIVKNRNMFTVHTLGLRYLYHGIRIVKEDQPFSCHWE